MTEAVLIAGPTASGKSTAATALAENLTGTVINADSMQIYRELCMLTARPSTAEMAEVPHRLYGTVPGAEAYSVGRWLDDAATAIAEAHAQGRVPILVGGTGLYFKALIEGLSPVPDIPAEVRRFWRDQAKALGPEGLHRELTRRDPIMAARLRPTDPQRMVRALEVVDATDVSLAQWQGRESTPVVASASACKLVVAPEREQLYAAIDARLDRMIAAGAVAEVKSLMASGLDPGLPVMRAHGVQELSAYVSGRITLEEAVTKAKTETRRYAKRQMTWLKRFMTDWEWVPDGEAAAVAVANCATP
jgi:tRNA dimethylallyltransferase